MNVRATRALFCALFTLTLLPQHADADQIRHAEIIRQLDDAAFERGKKTYNTFCFACHGKDGKTPLNPQARSFATAEMKNGADPYSLWKTVTDGFNTMPATKAALNPQQRYDVIHYIREAFLKKDNPSQYTKVDDAYLGALPVTAETAQVLDERERDYGPVLGAQLGGSVNNALHFRLPHQVTYSFDLHRFRSAGLWTDGFLDLSETQHYKQRGERMPKPAGPPLPGLDTFVWQLGDSFDVRDGDKPKRGPVREDLARYHGHYLHGDRAILSYTIGKRHVMETVGVDRSPSLLATHHTLRVGPGDHPLRVAVASYDAKSTAGVIPFGETEPTGRSADAAGHLAYVTGKPPRRAPDRPRHVIKGKDAKKLDLGMPNRTVVVRFKTEGQGTLIASAPAKGKWKPNGKSLFVRGGKLVYDIGWVGAITSKQRVNDGKWHTAALVVEKDETRLYVDGKPAGAREAFHRPYEKGHVLKIGSTATDFGGDYAGEIASVEIFNKVLTEEQIESAGRSPDKVDAKSLLAWHPKAGTPAPKVKTPESSYAAAAVVGDTDSLRWEIDDAGRAVLTIPASKKPRVFRIIRSAGVGDEDLTRLSDYVRFSASSAKLVDPASLTKGGPTRWPQTLTVTGSLGDPINGYALDTIPVPFENPWNAWVRTSAVAFFPDGRAVVTTHGGDVYIVSGIDDTLGKVTWKRYAAGLFEPFGVLVVDNKIYVTCRDGLKRLHDYDGNGEADFVEAFYVDTDVSSKFHAYNFDLQLDSKGNFYFAKAGQYTHYDIPGTILRVPPQGGKADIVAWGIRTPNGMGALPGDRFTVSDNQGPWMPAGKVSLIVPGTDQFFGNMPNGSQESWVLSHRGELPETFVEPFIWTPQELDNSCGGQVWVDDKRFGPLGDGRLIHSSFGKGWLYYMSLQEIDGVTQSSIVTLPHQWDAGVMRLRVNPKDGQVYGTGLSGWQGPRGGKDGCLQRLRYTGDKARIIERTRVTPEGIEFTFNFEVDAKSAKADDAWTAEMWNYLWSRRYGSDQFSVRNPEEKGHDKLSVSKVAVGNDGRTVHVHFDDLRVCDQLKLDVAVKDAKGQPFKERVYFTIHNIPTK